MTQRSPACGRHVPHFSSGPCAKRPGWTLQALTDAVLGRSHRSKIGKAKLKRAIDLTREVLEVPADYRIGIVPASDTGAVEMALWSLLGARPVTMLAWESFGEGWVTRRRQAAQAQGRHHAASAATASCPICRKVDLDDRRRVHLERHHLRRARAERRLDRGRPRRPHDLRRDLGGVRAAARLGQARCRDLLLAEGARRRGRARHADPVAARGRAARKLHAGLAAAEDLPHDQGRQAQSKASSKARPSTRRRCCASRIISTRCNWAKSIGGLKALIARADANAKVIADWVAKTPWIDFLAEGSGDPLQHLGLPEGRRSGGHRAAGRCAGGVRQGARRRCSRRRASPTTSAPTATRRRACASGAARRSKRADVEALTPWLDWAFAKAKAALPKAA